jgi:hypothetical protein
MADPTPLLAVVERIAAALERQAAAQERQATAIERGASVPRPARRIAPVDDEFPITDTDRAAARAIARKLGLHVKATR